VTPHFLLFQAPLDALVDIDLSPLFLRSPLRSPATPPRPVRPRADDDLDDTEGSDDTRPHPKGSKGFHNPKPVYYIHGMVFRLMLSEEIVIEENGGLRVVAICTVTGDRYFVAREGALFEQAHALSITFGRHRDLFMVLLRAGLIKEGSDKALLVPEKALLLHFVEPVVLADDFVMLAGPRKCTFHNMGGKRASVMAIASRAGELGFLSRDLDKSKITFSRSKAIRLSLQEDPAAILALRAAKVVPRNTMRAMLVSEKNVYWVKE
jgi:hypothetical protein